MCEKEAILPSQSAQSTDIAAGHAFARSVYGHTGERAQDRQAAYQWKWMQETPEKWRPNLSTSLGYDRVFFPSRMGDFNKHFLDK